MLPVGTCAPHMMEDGRYGSIPLRFEPPASSFCGSSWILSLSLSPCGWHQKNNGPVMTMNQLFNAHIIPMPVMLKIMQQGSSNCKEIKVQNRRRLFKGILHNNNNNNIYNNWVFSKWSKSVLDYLLFCMWTRCKQSSSTATIFFSFFPLVVPAKIVHRSLCRISLLRSSQHL